MRVKNLKQTSKVVKKFYVHQNCFQSDGLLSADMRFVEVKVKITNFRRSGSKKYMSYMGLKKYIEAINSSVFEEDYCYRGMI